MSQPLVLLFDIDGTLVTTGGAGRRALDRVFSERYARTDVFAGFSFAGMTDPAIVREGLSRVGQPFDPSTSQALLDHYLACLADELSRTRTHRLHDGMREAVSRAREQANIAVGLGTGNVITGAKVKLAPLGAYDWFGFGGFGSDAEDRAALIRIGLERGAATLGVPRADCRCVIIGDTPKDIAAAKANGAETLAVATGQFSRDALHEAGAEAAFDTIAAPGALDFLLRRQ